MFSTSKTSQKKTWLVFCIQQFWISQLVFYNLLRLSLLLISFSCALYPIIFFCTLHLFLCFFSWIFHCVNSYNIGQCLSEQFGRKGGEGGGEEKKERRSKRKKQERTDDPKKWEISKRQSRRKWRNTYKNEVKRREVSNCHLTLWKPRRSSQVKGEGTKKHKIKRKQGEEMKNKKKRKEREKERKNNKKATEFFFKLINW